MKNVCPHLGDGKDIPSYFPASWQLYLNCVLLRLTWHNLVKAKALKDRALTPSFLLNYHLILSSHLGLKAQCPKWSFLSCAQSLPLVDWRLYCSLRSVGLDLTSPFNLYLALKPLFGLCFGFAWLFGFFFNPGFKQSLHSANGRLQDNTFQHVIHKCRLPVNSAQEPINDE